MASTKMARNRKARDKKFKELPWVEKQRLIESKKHDMYLELNKLLNNG